MAVSAHGLRLTFNGVTVPDLGDVTPPALQRKPVEDTRHRDIDDAHVPGIHRHGHMVFDTAVVTGVEWFVTAWLGHTLDAYTLTFADGAVWSFHGYVVDVSPHAPVDERLSAQVTVVVRGRIALGLGAHASSLLLETGDYVLLESGDTILLEQQ